MLRFAFRLLAVLVVLIVVLVGGIFLISGERLAKIAGDQITSMSGREVTLSGSLRPQLFPNLGVRTGGFDIAGSSGDAPLISGEALSVGVDLWALLSRRIEVQEVTLVGPVVTLIKDADGRVNWDAGGEDAPAASGGGGGQSDISLAGLSVQDGTFRYQDAVAGTDLVLEKIDVSASMPTAQSPLTASISFVSGGQAASADIQISALNALLAGAFSGVTLEARVGQNSIVFAGAASVDDGVTGDFSADLPAPEDLMALTGAAQTLVPAEYLPIVVSGTMSASGDTIEIARGSYQFGENRLQGPVSVDLGDVPFVQAVLNANALDLSFLAAEEGSATEGDAAPADGTGWSTDPIDASGVGLLDADVTLQAASIDFGTTKMQDVSLSVTIENARAVARILRAQAFGGAFSGRFVVNNRNGLSVAGDMDGTTVAIQALLTDMAGFDRMRGAGNTQLSFLGVGQSLDQIMRSLSGAGSLDIGQGDITGFDLGSLFGGSDTADAVGERATTIFQSLSASFVIDGGVLSNNDLVMSASLFEARGQGTVDLGGQRLDYRLIPRVFETSATRGLSIPVRIEGPWSKPRIYPDLEFVAKQKLREQEDRVKEQAKERLEEEKQSIEDRVKDKLENELLRGLGGLFD